MKAKDIITQILLCFITFPLAASCKDDTKDIESFFEIASAELSKEIDKSAATLTIPVKTSLEQSAWNAESTEKWARVRKSITAGDGESAITVTVDENTGEEARSTQIKVTSNIRNYVITLKQYGANDVVIGEDIQIKPYGGKASEYNRDTI